jgi:fucose permease
VLEEPPSSKVRAPKSIQIVRPVPEALSGSRSRALSYSARVSKPAALLLVLAYAAFISLGLPDTVFGVAWPSLRSEFGLSQSAIGAVLAAAVSGYFLSGILAGAAIRRLGVGGLLAVSSIVAALALLGYALAPSWNSFFPIALIMGLGSGAIDSGLNSYAAAHFSVRQVNWLHACWGLGASIGPLIMTAAIARGDGYRGGYWVLTLVLGAMALAFLLTRRAWDDGALASAPSEGQAQESPARRSVRAALRSGRVWLQILTFFLYTGLESTIGQWCFSLLREGRGLSVEAAGSWTSAYWASLTLGRVALGFIVDRFGPDRLLRAASFGVVLGAAAFVASDGPLGRAGLLLMGLGLAPVYPTLMARTPARLGAGLAQHAIGFQVSAAVLGSSLVPALVGILIASTGLGAISVMVLVLSLAFLLVHELLLRAT